LERLFLAQVQTHRAPPRGEVGDKTVFDILLLSAHDTGCSQFKDGDALPSAATQAVGRALAKVDYDLLPEALKSYYTTLTTLQQTAPAQAVHEPLDADTTALIDLSSLCSDFPLTSSKPELPPRMSAGRLKQMVGETARPTEDFKLNSTGRSLRTQWCSLKTE
jgi:hypothetical protein